MKKILLIHFWFGVKNRTCGLKYSGFRDIFQERKWEKTSEEEKKAHRSVLECLHSLLNSHTAHARQWLGHQLGLERRKN